MVYGIRSLQENFQYWKRMEEKAFTASRLTSPGTTKPKGQQKTQRDARSQIVGPRVAMPVAKGSPGSLTKHYSGSRIPGKGSIPNPAIEQQTTNDERQKPSSLVPTRKPLEQQKPSSDSKSKLKGIPQTNYRSNITRLPTKNSHPGSECGSDTTTTSSSSSRTKPSYGSQSPLDSSKEVVSPPIVVNSTIPESGGETKGSLPLSKTRTLPTFSKKHSSETSAIRRERTFDASADKRKCSSPYMGSHRKSVENLDSHRKSVEDISADVKKGLGLSTCFIPSSGLKSSSESLPATLLDDNSLNQRYESSSSIASSSRRSSIESTASDSSDASRLPKRYSSKLPLCSSDKKKSSNSRGGPGIPSVSKKPSFQGSPNPKAKEGGGSERLPGSRMKLPSANSSSSSSSSRRSDAADLRLPPSTNNLTTDKFSTLPAKLPSATKGNTATKSSIRHPGTTLLPDDSKKKKFTSPLTHRNKLTYVNDKNTSEATLSLAKTPCKMKSEESNDTKPTQMQAEQIKLPNNEQQKLRFQDNRISKLSPVAQRSTKNNTNAAATLGIRPPTTTISYGIPHSSTAPSKLSSFGFKLAPNEQDIQYEKPDVDVEKEEVEELEKYDGMKKAEVVRLSESPTKEVGKEEVSADVCRAEEVKAGGDGDNDENTNDVVVAVSRKMDDMHIFVDDMREMESINSSRSSEMDDGYSSLHKLDNLSPTLTEEFSKTSTDNDPDTSRSDVEMKQDPIISSSFLMRNDDMLTEEKTDGEVMTCDSGFHTSVKEQPPNGFTDQDDSIQVDMSGYKEPQDNKLSSDDEIDADDSHNRCAVDLKLNFQHTYSICEYSPVTPDNEGTTPLDENDPFTKAFQNSPSTRRSHGSPFKRIHPKVMIPPPHLHSIANNGELAPVPSEYMRTPSSDGDDFMLTKHFSGDLRRRAREQAKEARAKNVCHDEFHESDVRRVGADVFYTTTEKELPLKISTRMSTRSSTTSFDMPPTGSLYTAEDKQRTESTSSDQEKKKKFKLKKFFKKLSTNKKDCKVDFDLTSVDGFDSRFGTEGCPEVNACRRCSLGSGSCHSSQDIQPDNSSPTTSFSKRRMFNFNFSSFKRKGKRNRSATGSSSIFTDEVHCLGVDIPSNTVRALCSPELSRKERPCTRYSRRGSDPSLYMSQVRSSSPSKKSQHDGGGDPANIVYYSDTDYVDALHVSSSTFSDDVDYAIWPFSKVNMKPPIKPHRKKQGSDRCSMDSCSINSSGTPDERVPFTTTVTAKTVDSPLTASTRKRLGKAEDEQCERTSNGSHCSDTCSLLSADYPYSSSKGSLPYDSSSARSTGSLRRTPLRHSVDSFSKLLEVHKQTIEKIATEISSLRCDCDILNDLEWDDFERDEETIQLGLNSYMVVPVTCASKLGDKRKFYAWLRLSQHGNNDISDYPNVNISKSTLHRNCVHACHVMQQDYTAPLQEGIPKAIQINDVYISTQCPKMTLSRYISLTLEKHARYSEIYEREAAMVMLQVVKGIQNLYANDVRITCIDSDNIFILNNGEPSVVLSPRREPNRCPALAVAALPGLGNCFQKTETDSITSICHQLAFLLFQLLHCPYQDELNDAVDMSMLLATLPDVTIKSIYSRYLQYVINLLLGTSSHTSKSLQDLQVILEIILFGPSDISEHSEEETMLLINKWHNRRCVDMVTHILKEAPLIMLCASGPTAQDIEKIKNVDQEILLECEFLSRISAADIYRVSKMLNR